MIADETYKEIIIESYKPRNVKIIQCKECKTSIEYIVPEDKSISYKIQCYNCNALNIKTEAKKEKPKPFFTNTKQGTDEKPLETEYYEILGISPTATEAEIKKAYRIMALKYHPDKNPDNKEAEDMFKKVAEAYQILSDPQLRANYNKYGKSDANGETMMDPTEFFKQQFGGEKFNDYIGDLALTSQFSSAMSGEEPEENTPEKEMEREKERKEKHEKRVAELTEKMIKKLEGHTYEMRKYYANQVQLKEESKKAIQTFKLKIEEEANDLKYENHGVELLHAIGYIYKIKASQAISQYKVDNGAIHKKIFGYTNKFTSKLKERSHAISETVGTIKSAYELQSSFEKLQQQAENPNLTEEEKLRIKETLETEAALKGMETLWRGSKLEIESVLTEVCDKTLNDPSAPQLERRERAKALYAIGEVFEKVQPLKTQPIF